MLKKITKVDLVNFKSYERETIDLSGDIVVIWGESREGKSNLIKSLLFNLYNIVPSNMARMGSDGNVIVRTHWNDGTIIERARVNGENYYNIFNADGSEFIPGGLSGFGSQPVPEVIAFHGMLDSDFMGDKSFPNVSSQFDLCFFITKSDYEKAKTFGRMANVDTLDDAITKASSRKREDKKKLSEHTKELKEKKQAFKELKNIDKMKKDSDKIKKDLAKIKSLEDIVEKLEVSKNDITILSNKIHEYTSLLSKEKDVSEIIEYMDTAIAMLDKMSELDDFNDSIEKMLTKKATQNKVIQSASEESIKEVIEAIDKATEISKSINDLLNIKDNLSSNIERKARCEALINSADRMDEVIEYANKALSLLSESDELYSKRMDLDNKLQRRETLSKNLLGYSDEYLESLDEYCNALHEMKICPVCFRSTEKGIDVKIIKDNVN